MVFLFKHAGTQVETEFFAPTICSVGCLHFILSRFRRNGGDMPTEKFMAELCNYVAFFECFCVAVLSRMTLKLRWMGFCIKWNEAV